MIILLAQIIEPPIQPGPARIPGREVPISKPKEIRLEIEGDQNDSGIFDKQSADEGDAAITVEGDLPYNKREARKILNDCNQYNNFNKASKCASDINARLQRDGYINTRVISESKNGSSQLIIIPGRLIEIHINSKSEWLSSKIEKLLNPLLNRIFNIYEIKNALLKVERLGITSQISGSIGKLGSNPTKATLNITAEESPKPWRGQATIRNDGNTGSGEWRSMTVIQKKNLLVRGDIFQFYGELNTDKDPELGAGIGSLSYTYPVTQNLGITSSFGASRRYLVEFSKPFRDLSFRQYQGLIQGDWTFHESATTSSYAFLGISANHNNSYYKNESIPIILGGGIDGDLTGGYARIGVGHRRTINSFSWTGQLYGLQGINSFSSQDELRNLRYIGVRPSAARAIGAYTTGLWAINKKLIAKGIAGGQFALNPLTTSMGFSVGSNNGLRGLPGTLISGDNGWISNLELEWSLLKFKDNQIKVVPFGGAGGIRTTRVGVTLDDTVGSYGVLVRWQHRNKLSVDLGWAKQFNVDDNAGLWNNWTIGNGLYTKVSYQF